MKNDRMSVLVPRRPVMQARRGQGRPPSKGLPEHGESLNILNGYYYVVIMMLLLLVLLLVLVVLYVYIHILHTHTLVVLCLGI